MFKWYEKPGDGDDYMLNIYQNADNLCWQTNNQPNCKDSRNFTVIGTKAGKTNLVFEATKVPTNIYKQHTILDSTTFSIEVINQAEQPLIYEDKFDAIEPMVIDEQVYEYLPGLTDPMNGEVDDLKEELKKQQKQLEEQNK